MDGIGVAVDFSLDLVERGEVGNAGDRREDGHREQGRDFVVAGHLVRDDADGKINGRESGKKVGKVGKERDVVTMLMN